MPYDVTDVESCERDGCKRACWAASLLAEAPHLEVVVAAYRRQHVAEELECIAEGEDGIGLLEVVTELVGKAVPQCNGCKEVSLLEMEATRRIVRTAEDIPGEGDAVAGGRMVVVA